MTNTNVNPLEIERTTNRALAGIASELAYDDWDSHHGFGLYHTGEAVKRAEIERARKVIDKWVDKLSAIIEADVKGKLIAELNKNINNNEHDAAYKVELEEFITQTTLSKISPITDTL